MVFETAFRPKFETCCAEFSNVVPNPVLLLKLLSHQYNAQKVQLHIQT